MYALLQNHINILLCRTNFAMVGTLKAIQRSKPQKQHVQMTSNVAVFKIWIVTVVYGLQKKVLLSAILGDIAHGQ